MIKTIPIFVLMLFFYGHVKAQAADSTLKKSPVKSLSDSQYDALLKGEDIYSMPPVAPINHYPTPERAIKFKAEIDLSPVQVTKIAAIAKELKRKKLEMGVFIVRNERALDSLFRRSRLDDGTIVFYANRSGLYYGELRNAILQACFRTGNLMSPGQIKKLETLQNHN
ncbi:hypothetical protein SAMN05216464_12162 [Mucilaginibacter pineti]|uniref:Uncharacterized protein n=1 Tax=Mucilaginibacter pineti TaxID=1391627 RepID=A0A1G7MEW2_9SPHI|nr:hypothetical protein [Mucilaginibacter pineti]SDF60358.1 hypothetical protein SAMN05216464_12162 [Mucilaginibacter pineti]